ncbi:MAG: hypothetical protein F4Y88_06505 [Chloroflexi bacterium]|nr:hypothetical protein [Chloroflexota bacterium]
MQEPTKTFGRLAQRVAAEALRGRVQPLPVPMLTTFHRESYFNPKDLDLLLRLRSAIDNEESAGARERDIDLARLCLAASVEPVSSLRRDGRALRYVPTKERARPTEAFLEHAHRIELDMPVERVSIGGGVHLGDGRSMSVVQPHANFDLVLFSPPYPNNIDYTEVYKMEAWLLGMFSDAATFRSQRLKTVHSHPSLMRDPANDHSTHIAEVVAPLLHAIPEDRYSIQRRSMVCGYARDMAQTLESAWDRLRPGGSLVYIVGNSLHGKEGEGFVVAADLIMAELATHQGFSVDRLDVARRLHRRHSRSPFLRESVVFARKPRN